MFSRLSKACSRLSDLGWNVDGDNGGSGEADNGTAIDSSEDFLPPDVTAMSQLSLSVPENALESVVGVCGKMFSPFCQYVGSRLSTDVEKLVISLHEADPDFAADMEDEDEDIYVIPFHSPDESNAFLQLPSDESVGSYAEGSSLLCLSGAQDVPESMQAPQGVLIPRIIITPAPPQRCREMSSCVPVQDTSFGARLTVPSHSALNTSHPPMAAPFYPHAPLHVTVRNWTYRFGHWCAVAPALDEQERRGIFSRPISARRRKMRKRAGGVRDVSASCQNIFARTKRDS